MSKSPIHPSTVYATRILNRYSCRASDRSPVHTFPLPTCAYKSKRRPRSVHPPGASKQQLVWIHERWHEHKAEFVCPYAGFASITYSESSNAVGGSGEATFRTACGTASQCRRSLSQAPTRHQSIAKRCATRAFGLTSVVATGGHKGEVYTQGGSECHCRASTRKK